MHDVASSRMKAVGYRKAEGKQPAELCIDFGGTDWYLYTGPDIEDRFIELMAADSKGSYFHHQIRLPKKQDGSLKYPFRKIAKP